MAKVLMWAYIASTQIWIVWLARYPFGWTDVIYIFPIEFSAVVAWAAVYLFTRRTPDFRRQNGLNSFSPLIAISFTLICIFAKIPLRIGFLMSRDSLKHAVTFTLQGRSKRVGDFPKVFIGPAGAYYISYSGEQRPNEILLCIKTPSFFAGSAVFVYSPNGPPLEFDTLLGNGWYAYRRYGHFI
jgi:hypothetical protein